MPYLMNKSFNNTLTNDIVSFEQLDPDFLSDGLSSSVTILLLFFFFFFYQENIEKAKIVKLYYMVAESELLLLNPKF